MPEALAAATSSNRDDATFVQQSIQTTASPRKSAFVAAVMLHSLSLVFELHTRHVFSVGTLVQENIMPHIHIIDSMVNTLRDNPPRRLTPSPSCPSRAAHVPPLPFLSPVRPRASCQSARSRWRSSCWPTPPFEEPQTRTRPRDDLCYESD